LPAPSQIFAPDALDGRVVLVTGGGTNLGKHAAIELAAAGASVVIAGRRHDALEAALDEIGERAELVVGDVRDAADATRMIETARRRHGRFDVLVNNAGGQYFSPAEEIVGKGWDAVQRLNVGGTYTMMRAAAGVGFGAEGGTIVNVTVSPHHGMPAMVHTGAARAAVEALTIELAREWRSREVALVAVAVGRFDTASLRKYPEVVVEGAARSVPLQRLGTMHEFGWLIALLAGRLGRALSGSVVTLDGAADNWFGPWPPPGMVDDAGEVPTEARRRPDPTA
jgi:NAD(P)-dependent dehydrogenase (short-subunit alcohol dehydrogenase family)